MKDFIKICIGFVSIVLPAAVILFCLPARYRVHPALTRPVYMPDDVFTFRNTRIILIGDSLAARAPWEYGRITTPGLDEKYEPLLENIAAYGRRYTNCEKVVVMYGVGATVCGASPSEIESRIKTITSVARANFPDAEIQVVSPETIVKIAIDHNIGDGWHLDKTGYEILRAEYPDIFSPPQ